MKGMIRAEILKNRRSNTMRMAVAAPVTAVFLGYLITQVGIYAQQFTYNIWYAFFYPCLVPLLCAMNIRREQRMHYQSLLTSPRFGKGQWAAKCIAVGSELLLSQVLFSLLMWIVGCIFGNSLGMGAGILGMLLVWLVSLWQIPLYLWLASKVGMVLSVTLGFLISSAGGVIVAEENWFYLFPFSIGPRFMCSVLHIRPNGLRVEPGSSLLGYGVLAPGIGVSLLLLAVLGWVSVKWWERREAV